MMKYIGGKIATTNPTARPQPTYIYIYDFLHFFSLVYLPQSVLLLEPWLVWSRAMGPYTTTNQRKGIRTPPKVGDEPSRTTNSWEQANGCKKRPETPAPVRPSPSRRKLEARLTPTKGRPPSQIRAPKTRFHKRKRRTKSKSLAVATSSLPMILQRPAQSTGGRQPRARMESTHNSTTLVSTKAPPPPDGLHCNSRRKVRNLSYSGQTHSG